MNLTEAEIQKMFLDADQQREANSITDVEDKETSTKLYNLTWQDQENVETNKVTDTLESILFEIQGTWRGWQKDA